MVALTNKIPEDIRHKWMISGKVQLQRFEVTLDVSDAPDHVKAAFSTLMNFLDKRINDYKETRKKVE